MNKKIAKLYDQAIVLEDGEDYVCGELDPVKFAELIVRECAYTARQCYIVRSADAEDVAKHIENQLLE